MNLNKAFVLGNVTRDPEVRALPSGQQVASFGIATNRFYTDQAGQKKQDAEFHNIVCFGKLADIASRYLTKGGLVLIEGRIKNSSWQGTDGIKKYKKKKTKKKKNKNTPKKKKIQIIKKNYTPPATNNDTSTPENTDEIDVK